uniref:Uncharacterized protein n=1 Tax=Mycena chlorophos TaxID=658473 RepID=A0ABQ0L2P1_MYCCL|nr:predicted protein [Mycena chlorophos]
MHSPLEPVVTFTGWFPVTSSTLGWATASRDQHLLLLRRANHAAQCRELTMLQADARCHATRTSLPRPVPRATSSLALEILDSAHWHTLANASGQARLSEVFRAPLPGSFRSQLLAFKASDGTPVHACVGGGLPTRCLWSAASVVRTHNRTLGQSSRIWSRGERHPVLCSELRRRQRVVAVLLSREAEKCWHVRHPPASRLMFGGSSSDLRKRLDSTPLLAGSLGSSIALTASR